jgi:hypothetical protein
MSIISINDLEFVKGKKLDLNSTYLRAGLQQLKKKNLVCYEENERVIELDELLIEIWEIARTNDNRACNTNAKGK